MYVKKFAGDSLDETLKMVKKELGPDAIILKTISNKGLKGAFKKSRIEITAAISEQNYAKKSRVDHVLNEEQKEKFYQAPASNINHMINDYSGNSSSISSFEGYGNIGLNKVVNTVSKASNKIKSSLDDFLGVPEPSEEEKIDLYEKVDVEKLQASFEEDNMPEPNLELRQQIKSQKNQIELLEQKLFELTQTISNLSHKSNDNEALKQLRTTLRTLDLNEKIVQDIIKKAQFELTSDDLKDAELIYEFALRELNNNIVTDMPLFSSTQVQGKSVITVLVSDGASGQSSMSVRLAILKDNANIVSYCSGSQSRSHELAKKVFDLEIFDASNVGEVLTYARKATEENKHLMIDLKMNTSNLDESKKVIETLKRSFDFVEVLVTLSAINSELYNRKILSKYQELANGVIITYIDQCMDYGALVNAHYEFQKLPLKFYGTGPVIPEDIEAATAERILAGMFQL